MDRMSEDMLDFAEARALMAKHLPPRQKDQQFPTPQGKVYFDTVFAAMCAIDAAMSAAKAYGP